MARNQHENAVAAFRRDINGLLTPVGRFPTGGAGNPFPQPGDPPVDPLASQGALIMSDGKRFLIAVNAGSNQISVLRINKNTLELADIVDSGGSRPISAALYDDLLYVLN
jgi:6-phosphogluconolactonase